MNAAQENYIKTILSLELENQTVTITKLAKSLSVRPASATEMVIKLQKAGWVKHKLYKSVTLSRKGRVAAAKILRRHRLWETFLHDILSFPWSEVHQEAERFEHLTSENMERRMDVLLGHPQFDPHGQPIPAEDGTINITADEKIWTPLSSLSLGQQGKIVQVKNESEPFLSYLDSINLKLDTIIKIDHILDFDQSMEIKTNNQKIFISHKVAKEIIVSPS
ncbi:MarR family transcriptional regulator [candidate division KSB1 bacterium]|nr:MarR family transcriptional regulator [candidate division KSB1 bacterium]